MPLEFLIMGLGIAVAGLGSFIAARASIGSGGLWPAAWGVVLVGVFADQIHHSGVSISLGHLFGTLFAGLILGGAIRFVGRPLPRWLLPAAVALGVSRALLAATGHGEVAGAIALLPEPLAELFAAHLVHRHSRRSGAPLPERLLAPALVLLAVVDVWTGVVAVSDGNRGPLVVLWLVGASVLSALQLLTFLGQLQERIRERTRQLASSNADLREEIAVRVRAEEALRLSQERYRVISGLNSDFSFVIRIDPGGESRVEWAAGAYEKITGYGIEETTSAGWNAFVHADDLERVQRYLRSQPPGRTSSLEYRIVCKDGSICWVEQASVIETAAATGEVLLYGAVHDITRRKAAELEKEQLEARMAEAEKLESLGVLAGGVAHDFNNLLTVILGNTAMVLHDLPDPSPHSERLERVRKTAQYAADLTGQMLAYAGSSVMVSKPLDLSSLAEDMLGLLAPELPANVRLGSNFPAGLPMVEGDDSRLRQVVLNLVTNAAEALGEQGGSLWVSTGTLHVGEDTLADALPSSDFDATEAVYLEVRDDGPGIEPEARARIFEPFYSTRTFTPGKKVSGRGLGLAAVLGIVRGHRGVIQLETAAGEGTCLRVLLPLTSAPLESRRADHVAPPQLAEPRTLLLIDDDEMVLEISHEFLKRAGFRVVMASSGAEGLARLVELGDEVGLVLLDFVMPDMDGEAVLERIRELRPELPVIAVSGFPQEARAGSERLALSGYLEKPYEPEALVTLVRSALE
jgi:two-component system cell cycle sensor histidine kinase/response regulator CckA